MIGVARTEWTDDEFRAHVTEATPEGGPKWQALTERFKYVAGEYDHPDTFDRLKDHLDEADRVDGTAGQPPLLPGHHPERVRPGGRGPGRPRLHPARARAASFVRVVVEKPYGRDLDSAIALDEQMHAAFDESQIYRIDHYMGKETVQNVLALRFANAIFEPIWNRRYVEQVQVTVAESLGVEHRGGFYETAGALRDIVQNHVMQVLALTLMESPTSTDADRIRDEKVKLLQAIDIPTPDEAVDKSVRGQYTAGRHRRREGHRLPPGARRLPRQPDRDLPGPAAAGGELAMGRGPHLRPHRQAAAGPGHRGGPHLPPGARSSSSTTGPAATCGPNTLILRIQPDEGISLEFGAKVPGEKFHIRSVAMDFSYAEAFAGAEAADGYERLIHDAMVGDATLFIRTDEVAAGLADRRPLPAGVVGAGRGHALLPGRDLGTAHGRPPGRAVGGRVAEPGDRPRAERRSAHRAAPVSGPPVNGTVDDRWRLGPRRLRRPGGRPAGRAAGRPVLAVPLRRAPPPTTPTSAWPSATGRDGPTPGPVDWTTVDVYLGDERCVPARRPGLQPPDGRRGPARAGRPGAAPTTPCTAPGRPTAAAAAYQSEIWPLAGLRPGPPRARAGRPHRLALPRLGGPGHRRSRPCWWWPTGTRRPTTPTTGSPSPCAGIARARLVVFTVSGRRSDEAFAGVAAGSRPPGRPGHRRRGALAGRCRGGGRTPAVPG